MHADKFRLGDLTRRSRNLCDKLDMLTTSSWQLSTFSMVADSMAGKGARAKRLAKWARAGGQGPSLGTSTSLDVVGVGAIVGEGRVVVGSVGGDVAGEV